MASRVPVLMITGPVGVGKTAVTGEASRLLGEAGIPHATADLAVIVSCWPPPCDDPWNEVLIHANLGCMWANFRRAGAARLLLCRVLETRSLLARVTKAVPGADITVVRLRARRELVQQRIVTRESGRDPQWYLDTAAYLFDRMEHTGVEDHVVDNDDRPVAQVAAEVLHVAGWPPTDTLSR